MTGSGAGGRSRRMRTVNTAVIGLAAGVSGVAVIRTILGPGVGLADAVVGVLAGAAAALLAWGISSPRRSHRGSGPLPGGRRPQTLTHPVGWVAPVGGSMVAMVAWAGVAHSSGSGWVQAVGALLAAVLVTGLVAPLFPARRATVTCTASPSDAEAGRPLTLTLTASGPLRIRPLHPVGPVARATGAARGSRTVEVTVGPERRGVLRTVVVESASSAPFGLLWWARKTEVALPRPLHVAPRFGDRRPMATVPDAPAGDAPLRVPAGAGEPRGVRPYVPGDTRRSIHWPATSHVGSLMVRERERQTDDPVVVDLVLPTDPHVAEADCETVMASLTHTMMRGQPVVLGTEEPGGRVVRVVRDRIDLGRRLARAVPPPVGGSPGPAAVREPRRRRWRG